MGREGFGGCMRRGERTMRVEQSRAGGRGLVPFNVRDADGQGSAKLLARQPFRNLLQSINKETADNAARPQRRFQQQCQSSYAITGNFRRWKTSILLWQILWMIAKCCHDAARSEAGLAGSTEVSVTLPVLKSLRKGVEGYRQHAKPNELCRSASLLHGEGDWTGW